MNRRKHNLSLGLLLFFSLSVGCKSVSYDEVSRTIGTDRKDLDAYLESGEKIRVYLNDGIKIGTTNVVSLKLAVSEYNEPTIKGEVISEEGTCKSPGGEEFHCLSAKAINGQIIFVDIANVHRIDVLETKREWFTPKASDVTKTILYCVVFFGECQ